MNRREFLATAGTSLALAAIPAVAVAAPLVLPREPFVYSPAFRGFYTMTLYDIGVGNIMEQIATFGAGNVDQIAMAVDRSVYTFMEDHGGYAAPILDRYVEMKLRVVITQRDHQDLGGNYQVYRFHWKGYESFLELSIAHSKRMRQLMLDTLPREPFPYVSHCYPNWFIMERISADEAR